MNHDGSNLVARHPLAAYFVLTFAISWGGFVGAVGPGAFPGTGTQFDARMPLVVTAMLAGPSLAAVLLTALLSGTQGLRELVSRLLAWRVGLRWYAAALIPAPVLSVALLLSQSLPVPVLGANGAAVLASGLVAGMTIVLEEVGWTGFAVRRLRTRHGVFSRHHPRPGVGSLASAAGALVAGAYAGDIPLPLFVALIFVGGGAQLVAYRVLMVWAYDRTESLLIATLMHASLTASTIFLFAPMATGARLLASVWLSAAAWWAVVGTVGMVNARLLGKPGHGYA